jgi:hypothetical protein
MRSEAVLLPGVLMLRRCGFTPTAWPSIGRATLRCDGCAVNASDEFEFARAATVTVQIPVAVGMTDGAFRGCGNQL